MKIVEMTGKTVEEALKNALKELNLTEDKVEFEIPQYVKDAIEWLNK